MPVAWINGKLLDESQAFLSIFDRSYLYGEGVFETLRCYRGVPAFLDRHHRRLVKNCRHVGIAAQLSQKDLAQTLSTLLAKNDLKEAVVRITLSNVGATFGVDPPRGAPVNIILFARPVTLDVKLFETGVKVLCSETLINNTPADIKSTSYLVKMLARAEASRAGAYETLLKNAKGNWAEGSRTNFFIVLDQTVITPPLSEGLLGGITRQVVLEILQGKKIDHREAPVTDAMLNKAEEIFLTGSTSEVMPVCEVMGRKKYAAGPLARQILDLYRQRLVS